MLLPGFMDLRSGFPIVLLVPPGDMAFLARAVSQLDDELVRCAIFSHVDAFPQTGGQGGILVLRFTRHWTALVPGIVRRMTHDLPITVILPTAAPASATRRLEAVLRASPAAQTHARTLRQAFSLLSAVPAATMLTVRFRRGDGWMPGRILKIDATTLSVATPVPPPAATLAHLELAVGTVVARLSARVTPHDESTPGVQAFTANFTLESNTDSAALERVLVAATGCYPTLPPPRARRAARFPARWPVLIMGTSDVTPAVARDLSVDGLFLETRNPPPIGEVLCLRLPIDDGGRPLVANAEVVRLFNANEAADRHCWEGCGMVLQDLDCEARARYHAFVERVARRTRLQVVVSASPHRAQELADALEAAGYAVSCPGAAIELTCELESRADLLLLDQIDEQPPLLPWRALRSLLDQRGIRAVRVDGAPSTWARRMADSVLLAA